MQKQKLVYEAPQADALVIRFEDSILIAGSQKLNAVFGTEYLGRENDEDVDML